MNELIYLILIILIIAILYSHNMNDYTITIFLTGVLIFYYLFFAWIEIENVQPNNKYKSLKHKVLWINTDYINEYDQNHVNWCNDVLIEHAPNQLGLYINNKYTSLETFENKLNKFNTLFGYKPDKVRIINSNKKIEAYTHKNNININNNIITRLQIKS